MVFFLRKYLREGRTDIYCGHVLKCIDNVLNVSPATFCTYNGETYDGEREFTWSVSFANLDLYGFVIVCPD